MDEELKQYRQGLVDTQRKLNESYDKLLITLSGGALALSMAFLKDVIGQNELNQPYLLLISWGLFVLSLTSILGEILFGIQAHKLAIRQIDSETIYDEKVGGKSSNWSTIFHWVAALSLVIGLFFISAFAFLNLGASNVGKESTAITAKNIAKPEAIAKPAAKNAN